jgi:hypothetical protein
MASLVLPSEMIFIYCGEPVNVSIPKGDRRLGGLEGRPLREE